MKSIGSFFLRHVGVVCNWNEGKGRGWIATLQNAPIYARSNEISARGDIGLQEKMLVEFEVMEQKGGGIYAAKITAPGGEAICLETGQVRKLILQSNSISIPNKEYYLGVVKMWKGKKGVIRLLKDARNVMVEERHVFWADGTKDHSLFVKDRVRLNLELFNNKLQATEVTHDNGLPYSIEYAQERFSDALHTYSAGSALAPPSGIEYRGPVRGVVKEWRNDQRAGLVISEFGERVGVHMGAIQTHDANPKLVVKDIVEFHLRTNVGEVLLAEHVTRPFNVIILVEDSNPNSKVHRKDPLKTGEFSCDICNLVLSSQVTLDSHLAGKAHLRRLKELELEHTLKPKKRESKLTLLDPCSDYFCGVCLWQGKDESDFFQHLETENHIEAEDYYGSDPELDELPEDYIYHCTACSKRMVTLDNWTKHVAGKKHRHMMDLKMMKYKECPLCSVVFTGRQHMQDHIAGRKHHDRVIENRGIDPVGDWRDWERSEEKRRRKFRKKIRKLRRQRQEQHSEDYREYKKRKKKKKKKAKKEVVIDVTKLDRFGDF